MLYEGFVLQVRVVDAHALGHRRMLLRHLLLAHLNNGIDAAPDVPNGIDMPCVADRAGLPSARPPHQSDQVASAFHFAPPDRSVCPDVEARAVDRNNGLVAQLEGNLGQGILRAARQHVLEQLGRRSCHQSDIDGRFGGLGEVHDGFVLLAHFRVGRRRADDMMRIRADLGHDSALLSGRFPHGLDFALGHGPNLGLRQRQSLARRLTRVLCDCVAHACEHSPEPHLLVFAFGAGRLLPRYDELNALFLARRYGRRRLSRGSTCSQADQHTEQQRHGQSARGCHGSRCPLGRSKSDHAMSGREIRANPGKYSRNTPPCFRSVSPFCVGRSRMSHRRAASDRPSQHGHDWRR